MKFRQMLTFLIYHLDSLRYYIMKLCAIDVIVFVKETVSAFCTFIMYDIWHSPTFNQKLLIWEKCMLPQISYMRFLALHFFYIKSLFFDYVSLVYVLLKINRVP